MSVDMDDPRGNFGILSSSCFTGSLVGQPPIVFAVMCYAVANARPYEDDELGLVGTLEINPALLAATFSVSPANVTDAIRTLCEPDPDSRSRVAEGRRLIHKGAFRYHLVNMAKYRKAESMDALREKWRADKRRQRSARTQVDTGGQSVDSPHVPLTLTLPLTSSSPKKRRTAKQSDDAGYETWYSHWPRKTAKHAGRRAWARMSEADRQTALEDIPKRGPLIRRSVTDDRYIQHPATFLNGRGWEDPLPTPADGRQVDMNRVEDYEYGS